MTFGFSANQVTLLIKIILAIFVHAWKAIPSLTYFADGVLADECGEIVDDVEEIIGDGLDHFGEYEDDSVFVRSDAKRCDYEILKDLRDFSDFKKKNFPPNNDEEV